MKKFLLVLAFFVFPVVAMEAESGKGESSSSYDADDESASCDDGRSMRWSVEMGGIHGKAQGRRWQGFASKMMPSESREARLAREQRIKDRELKNEQSSRGCCFFSFLRNKR